MTEGMLEGVRVIELAEWGFVPASCAVLAEWGADVIKVEHPTRGDPLRTLMAMGLMPDTGDFDMIVEHTNRSKRSVGLDVSNPAGYEAFLRLVAGADVLVTSFLDPARQRLKVTYEDLAPLNPRLIYARGSGQGQRGPDADKAGFDSISHWARGGNGHRLTPPGGPFTGQRAGFGDFTGGMTIACGVAAALYRRSCTGQGGQIDVSLFGLAVWQLAPDILASAYLGRDLPRTADRTPHNPLVGVYATSDGRYLVLNMMQSDRYWSSFCRAIEHPELEADPRFATVQARAAHGMELSSLLRTTFAGASLSKWDERLNHEECVWARVQTPLEVTQDPQVIANGYLPSHPTDARGRLAAVPIQFNGELPEVRSAAPAIGQHTDEVLRDAGLDSAALQRLRNAGAIAGGPALT